MESIGEIVFLTRIKKLNYPHPEVQKFFMQPNYLRNTVLDDEQTVKMNVVKMLLIKPYIDGNRIKINVMIYF